MLWLRRFAFLRRSSRPRDLKRLYYVVFLRSCHGGSCFMSVVFASPTNQVSDAQILATMRSVHERHGVCLCPHSATAVHAAETLGTFGSSALGESHRAAGAGQPQAQPLPPPSPSPSPSQQQPQPPPPRVAVCVRDDDTTLPSRHASMPTTKTTA